MVPASLAYTLQASVVGHDMLWSTLRLWRYALFVAMALIISTCLDRSQARAAELAIARTSDAAAATGVTRSLQAGPLAKPGAKKIFQPKRANPYSKDWPNTIAVCAIMKDETEQDVQEFLEYHRWIGVDSFFIRENGDSCKARRVLEPYERLGVLNFDLAPGPKYPLQTNWYNQCARLAAVKHSWVAFIDLDEFMVVLNKQEAVTEQGSLKELMWTYFRYNAVVSLQWLLFGSNGHKEPPAEGQLEGFRRCSGVPSRQMKCVANTYWFHSSGTFQWNQVHQSIFRMGGVGVFGDGEPLPMMHAVTLPDNITARGAVAVTYPAHLKGELSTSHTELTSSYRIVLNHYVTRAQDEFIERKIRLGGTGKFAQAFEATMAGLGNQEEVDEAYRKFEEDFGFDGDHAACQQGAKVAMAMRAAMAADTWQPIPSQPGLLAGGMARLLRG
eukprot:jgi/Ulvmu1/11816/UM080_0027.1